MKVYRQPTAPPPAPDDAPGALSEWAAAKFLGIGSRTLWGLRQSGCGPKHIRIGRSIRYPRHLLVAWMDERAERGTT